MPTIIALDVSLSMQRTIPGRSEDNSLTYHQLALKGIGQFLEYLANNSRMEYVSLVTYSTACEIKVEFTREYEIIRQAVKKIDHGDKSSIYTLLKKVSGILSTNWGTQSYCQVIVFTDCGLGFGSTSIYNLIQNFITNKADAEYTWIPVLTPTKLNFVCMGLHSDYYFTKASQVYQQLLDLTGLKGQLFFPKTKEQTDALDTDATAKHMTTVQNQSSNCHPHKSELGRTTMFEMVERLCETNFKSFDAVLKCGSYFRLECPIVMWPPPKPFERTHDTIIDCKNAQNISRKIEICGYLSLSEIGSPASVSRHFITPKIEREKPNRRSSEKSSKSNSSAATNQKPTIDAASQANSEFEKLESEIRTFYSKGDPDDDDGTKSSSISETNRESLCVLLHAALRMENMAALVLLGNNWYGFIHSFADSRKKSNLLLNILPPGSNVIPWLGDLNMLGMSDDFLPGESSSFPVKSEKRSYSQSCVVWIKHASLQSDIQKVLRHAKKIPEKTQHFYKELNRIRRAALSIGFIELLEALANIFEKEVAHLPMNANPECQLQLKHAAMELRKTSNRDLKVAINPLPKNFNDILYID